MEKTFYIYKVYCRRKMVLLLTYSHQCTVYTNRLLLHFLVLFDAFDLMRFRVFSSGWGYARLRDSSVGQGLGNANPGAFLKTRVSGFDCLQTRVPGYPGLIMSVRRPARVDGKPTVSGHLSESNLRSVGSCTLRGSRWLMEVS